MRVLPADAYDTLELSALAYGGIGAGPYFESFSEDGCPNCAFGHAVFTGGGNGFTTESWGVDDALTGAGIYPITSDGAVREINRRLRSGGSDARVSFAAWCKELGVVRGE